MKKTIIVALCLAIILVVILLKKRRKKLPASSLDGGIHYQLPFRDRKHFRLLLPNYNPITLSQILSNSVSHPNVEYTEVDYDGDLQSNSMIEYKSPDQPEKCAIVNIFIAGDIDPTNIFATR